MASRAKKSARERMMEHCDDLLFGPVVNGSYESSVRRARAKTRRLLAALLRERAEAARDAADLGFTEGRGRPGQLDGSGRHGMSVQHRTAVLSGIVAAVLRPGTFTQQGRILAHGGRP